MDLRPYGRTDWLAHQEALVLMQLERLAAQQALALTPVDPLVTAARDPAPGTLRRTINALGADAGMGVVAELDFEIAELRRMIAAREQATAAEAPDAPLPWPWLVEALALEPAEVDLLRALVVLATSPVAARLAAALGADATRLELLLPGVGLDFLTALLTPRPTDRPRLRHAARPESTLARYQLIEVRHEAVWPRVRASESLVAWVLDGALVPDPYVSWQARPAPPVPPETLVGAAAWPQLLGLLDDPAARALVIAAPSSAAERVIEGLAARAGRGLVQHALDLRTPPDHREARLRAAVRDAVLGRGWLALSLLGDAHGVLGEREVPEYVALLSEAPVPVVLTATARTALVTRLTAGYVQVELPALDVAELARLWIAASPGTERGPAGGAAALVAEVMRDHRLSPETLMRAAPDAVARATAAGRRVLSRDDVLEACAAQASTELGSLAVRHRGTFEWQDLILPPETRDQLQEVLSAASHRQTVMDAWGFGPKYPYGSCLSVLFSGPSGTGKTMAATLIATTLGRPLYRVDLSQIFDRYVGETEKNLSRIFDAAEAAHAVLLFDEADALFSKRTEVRSSNDRYANLEVNHLLQRLEHHHGVVILTTNLDASIDEAFRRRIRFSVRFPMPDEGTRATLWRSMIPPAAKLAADVDFSELGYAYDLPGGGIKNAVLRAAFLAAGDGLPIGMAHLARAARAECAALGKLVR